MADFLARLIVFLRSEIAQRSKSTFEGPALKRYAPNSLPLNSLRLKSLLSNPQRIILRKFRAGISWERILCTALGIADERRTIAGTNASTLQGRQVLQVVCRAVSRELMFSAGA